MCRRAGKGLPTYLWRLSWRETLRTYTKEMGAFRVLPRNPSIELGDEMSTL